MAGELIGGRPGRHSGDLDPGALYAPPKRRLGPPPAEEEDDTPKDILDTLERLLSSPDLYRIRDRILTSATRGAAAGVLIKGGLHTLTFIMYLLGKLRGGKGRQRAISLADVLRDTIVHTAFFAALGSTYTAVDEGLALVLGKERWVNARVQSYKLRCPRKLTPSTSPARAAGPYGLLARLRPPLYRDGYLGYVISSHKHMPGDCRSVPEGNCKCVNAISLCAAGLGGGGRWWLDS